jgi:hypothetical protein
MLRGARKETEKQQSPSSPVEVARALTEAREVLRGFETSALAGIAANIRRGGREPG